MRNWRARLAQTNCSTQRNGTATYRVRRVVSSTNFDVPSMPSSHLCCCLYASANIRGSSRKPSRPYPPWWPSFCDEREILGETWKYPLCESRRGLLAFLRLVSGEGRRMRQSSQELLDVKGQRSQFEAKHEVTNTGRRNEDLQNHAFGSRYLRAWHMASELLVCFSNHARNMILHQLIPRPSTCVAWSKLAVDGMYTSWP